MWRLLCHALGLAIVSGSSQLGEEGGRGEEVEGGGGGQTRVKGGGGGGHGAVCIPYGVLLEVLKSAFSFFSPWP